MFASVQLGFLKVVVLFRRFVDCREHTARTATTARKTLSKNIIFPVSVTISG